MSELTGKRVLVMGLGRFGGGVGVSRWLAGQGAVVTVTDRDPAEKLAESMAKLADLPIVYKLGGHDTADFTAADLVIVNPAVDRATSPYVQAAVQAGVAITTEMNLFLERCRGLTVGITGSVGKSTTTMLIYEALQAAVTGHDAADRPRVFLGGNIGKSLLEDLPAITPRDYVVLELSSFMLDETPAIRWSPRVALVTNLVANHLDRHGTMAAYAAAKQNILKFQTPQDVAILNADDMLVSRWSHFAHGTVVKFSGRGPHPIPLRMPGDHNQANARAALAVIDALRGWNPALNRDAALAAIQAFPGLAHRLQLVHTTQVEAPGGKKEIRWYNDSKATTPESSITALQAFAPGTAIVIVGGYDKHSDLSAFETLVAKSAAGVVGIGATGRGMVERIAAGGGKAAYVGTLDQAVPQAAAWAREQLAAVPGPIAVVLSPACASWDQFSNYEQRGELFATLAQKSTG